MNKITLHSLDQLLVHLDQNPKTKGIEFERSCKWFLENDPEYKQQLQKVWSWNDWPGSNGKRDTGIDLIAQDVKGKIWAIQVKAYDENYYITKADIDSFLSASSRSDISFRLLIATTNKIGSIGRDTFADQEKPVSLCLRDKLEISPIDWMLSLTDTKFIQKNIKTPRDHQQQALDAIIKGFEIVPSKGQIHMACGTGKSLLGLWLAQKLQAQYTLVLVPSISLVSQLRRTWAENSGDFIFDSIFVCSDQTVGYKHSDEQQEAFEMGFPATTNAHELIQQLSSNSRPKVIFSTYHSSMVIQQACKLKPDLIFDLVIADEAHRCVGKVKSDFAIITDDTKIRAHRKLYMTATPRIYTERVKNKTQEYECEIASMDDEEKFGPVLYRLPFSEAIKQELLTDYQVIISVIDHDTYRDYAEKGKFINIDDYEADARKTATQLLIAQAIRKYGLKKIISFHNGVSVAQDFIQTIPKAIELLPQDDRPQIDYSNVVHGEQSQSERHKILKNFDNPDFTGAVIIGNDRCLREGVDIPALDGIVFADPKNSEVDIIQGVGRAIRLSGDKKIGTIVIPVFIDKQSQGIEDLENSCFKKVWQIIKALRTHDDVLAEELDNIRLELGKRTYRAPAKLPSKIIIDIPITLIDKHFAQWIESKIVEEVIEKCTDSWNFYFGLLQEYVDAYGNASVPSEFITLNFNLGSWVSTQRKNYKKHFLSIEQIKQLEILPGWHWDKLDANWLKAFMLLSDYLSTHGHLHIPYNLTIENVNLSQWIAIQRKSFKKNLISGDRIKRLESLNGWTWDPFDKKWEKGIAYLNSFYSREGHVNIPANYIEQDFKLGIWIRNKKQNYKKGILSTQHQLILESFKGLTWDNDIEFQWKQNFSILIEFIKIYGHARVARGSKFNNLNLDVWVSTQRRAKFLNRLCIEKVNMLEALPGWTWNTIDYNNKQAFSMLDMYTKREGHAFVPTNHIELDFKLGIWVSKQRLYFAKGILKQKIYERLMTYPGWYWNAHEGYWENGKSHLLYFHHIHKHCLIKNSHIENGFALGKWVQMHRYQYKKNKLSLDKIKFFNDLSGWYWTVN